jgi:hypothetical protein
MLHFSSVYTLAQFFSIIAFSMYLPELSVIFLSFYHDIISLNFLVIVLSKLHVFVLLRIMFM